jgi:repressor LexA
MARNGTPPSLAEIAAAAGNRSRAAALRHVRALAQAGYIELIPGRKRGIRLVGDAAVGLGELPLAGRIAAGKPIEAIPGAETLPVANFFRGKDLFALQVQGDSMSGAGIMDGDSVVVEPTAQARNGDIVVALIDGKEVTLKRLKRGDGTVTLIPENPHLKPVTYEVSRVEIQGVVVGQMRTYR